MTDVGTPSLAATATFTIDVAAVNHAPVLAPIDDLTVDPGATVQFTAAANDPDPGQALSYGHDPGAPTGSSKEVTSITVGFDEALNNASIVGHPDLYQVIGGVKKRGKTTFRKPVGIKSVQYDDVTREVTIGLAKPYKGVVQLTIQAGIVAANGASSDREFTADVR